MRSPDLLGLEHLDRRQFGRWRARAVAALIVARPALASPDDAGEDAAFDDGLQAANMASMDHDDVRLQGAC